MNLIFRDSKLSLKEQAVVYGKVNSICKDFKTALESVNASKYTQTLLTTYVKQSPPDLESAMKTIKDIKSTSLHYSLTFQQINPQKKQNPQSNT